MRHKQYRSVALVIVALAAITVLAATSCGGTKSADTSDAADTGSSTARSQPGAPDGDYKSVTVKDISANPQAYDGQEIMTEGNYAVGYCAACFLLKDGVAALRVEVSDSAPLPDEGKLGARMEVSGKVYIAQGSPNLVADKITYK